jgi:hypothetical protein
MHIAWIVSAQQLHMTPGWSGSSVASYRYRVVIPARGLSERGHRVSSIAVSEGGAGFGTAVEQMRGADVAVFGKLGDLRLHGRLLRAARGLGIGTVVDVCDDHFSDASDGEQHRAIVTEGDAVSVSSKFLAARVAETTSRPSTVIADPYEGSRGEPKWAPGATIVATWFGHPSNLVGLAKCFEQIRASGMPMHLIVVTKGVREVIDWCRWASVEGAPRLSLEFREWSLQATDRALRQCDVALLPTLTDNRYYLSKGPNRLVESLWAGRFVVAHRLPAYEDFGAWAWVNDDVAAGLAWAVGHPREIPGRIAAAQDYIAANFSPQSITRAWEMLLTQVNDQRAARGA